MQDPGKKRSEVRITENPIPEEDEVAGTHKTLRSSRSDYEVPRRARLRREPLSSERLVYLNEKRQFRRMRNRSCQTEQSKKKRRSSPNFEKLSSSSGSVTSSDAFLPYPHNQGTQTHPRSAVSSDQSSLESLTQSEDAYSIARRLSLNLEKRLRLGNGSRPRSWFGTYNRADF